MIGTVASELWHFLLKRCIGSAEWPHENQMLTKFRGYGLCWFTTWKGMTMRILTASVIIAAISLGTPAIVRAQGGPSQAEAPSTQSSTAIRAIQVVDIKELQPAVRSKVEEIAAQASAKDMQSLRESIDATPEAVSALKSKGLNSSHVVAVNVADGVLTMFAKTA
jgi:hypothetical protein